MKDSTQESIKKYPFKKLHHLGIPGAGGFFAYQKRSFSPRPAPAQNRRRTAAAEAVYRKLDEQTGEFALPEALVESEIQKLLQQKARESVKSEDDAEKFKAAMAEHRADAKTGVRRAESRWRGESVQGCKGRNELGVLCPKPSALSQGMILQDEEVGPDHAAPLPRGGGCNLASSEQLCD